MVFPAPVIPQFAGYPHTADFQNWITNPLGFCAYSVIFRAEQHTSQNTGSAGADTVLTLDFIDEDPFAGWNAGNNRWTPPYSAWYSVTVGVNVAATAASLQALASITGTMNELALAPVPGANTGGAFGQGVFYLNGGVDYVSAVISSSVSTSTDCSTSGRFPFLEIAFEST